MAGIYIHIPFCKQACHYCDFHFSTSLKKKGELLSALIKELELRKHELQDKTIETIYIGGGTPSLLKTDELQFLINAVFKNYNISNNPEITLEANPDDLDQHRIGKLLSTPINRLSIGIQSFFEDDLKAMNRAHNANEAINCLEDATKCFENISIDLIYGFPNMSLAKWNKNLDIAFQFGIQHISAYALTIEPKTALANFIKKAIYPPVTDDVAFQHFNHLITRTQQEGFEHYEISNFGKPNYFSRHNTSYWQGKDYLGIGPAAHSFIGNNRFWNIANNSKYIRSLGNDDIPATIEILSKDDLYNEMIMVGLRTIWGVSLVNIETELGNSYKIHALQQAKRHIDQQLLYIHDDKLLVTEKGKFLVDGIASDLFKLS